MDRHPLDPTSLVAGLAFLAVGITFLAVDLSARTQANVVWPVLLVALGVGLLLSNWQAGRRRREDGDTP